MKYRKRAPVVVLLVSGLLIYVGLTARGQTPPKAADAPQPSSPAADAALPELSRAYAKEFNAADAKAIADEYLADGEMVDDAGNIFRGRPAIEKEMTAYFKQSAGAKVQLDVESIRMIGRDLAIEDGVEIVTPAGDGPITRGRYTAVHVLRDGDWKIASSRSFNTENASAHEQLKQLSWLIGDWVDESPDATVKYRCQWSDSRNFLLVEFDAEIAGAGKLKGSQRIGWDPVCKQLKSWVFDSAGGFAEGHWTYVGDHWIVKASGVRPDGTVATSTNIYKPLDKDRYNWSSTERIVGGIQEPDVSVLIVRKPPAPQGQ